MNFKDELKKRILVIDGAMGTMQMALGIKPEDNFDLQSLKRPDDIKNIHAQVIQVASMAINAYHNREMCEDAIHLKRELAKLEIQLRESHISRLNRGLRESINTSSIHLDLLSEYKRIASLLCAHAYNNRV